ncbi:TonB-dependent receptor [Chitinophagaceae bacterium LB-8]|uniref:TonB-dependent receptor n=1 Tax=Paraflavisolibacter caeni TaxID=2982496 RepID=A0A9X3BHA8_9BACT|nr:TonB-dependent receptor [Paraflavisolibacter caeni]MCU7549247.1 TonB-dependent receptor [Paraflavisolibacter caeni]
MRIWLFAIMVLLSSIAFAQKKIIKGTVTGPDGKPLENVTVTVKGTKVATFTNTSGSYSIQVSGSNVLLVFSSVGYIQRELSPGVNATLNVTLQLKVAESEEVVVIGYGTAKKKDLTGSVGKLSMSDVQKAPVASFDQALAGRVAGVQVNAADGQPGSSMNIVVRGPNSVTQSNTPLYVVDGFPIENMDNNTINPADIESIEVLKDASATAIYGARGANGVVMITTKRGKAGAPVVKLNSYYGWQQNIKEMKVLNPYEYVKYQIEANPSKTPGTPPPPTLLYLGGGTTMDYYKDTADVLDYQSQIFQDAPTFNNSLSITGGNDKTKYALSGNIFDQKGVIITSAFKRYQGRFVLDQTLNNKVKVGINTNYSYLEQNGLSVGGSNFSGTLNLMYSVWGYRPVNPSPASKAALNGVDFDITDDSNTDPLVSSANDYRFNPFKSLKNTLSKNITKNLLTNAYLEYRIIPSLVLKVTGGIDNRLVTSQKFYNSQTAQGSLGSVGGSPNGSINDNNYTALLNENYITYTKSVKKIHDISAMAGMSNQQVQTSIHGFSANKVPNEQLGINALAQGTPLSNTTTASSNTTVSLLGRVNYSYKSKYLLTASYRADGSSKFSTENRWAYFPSGAIAWRISREKFMDGLSNVISEAKLKASYGKTGNNRVSDFAYLSVYNMDPFFGYTFNNQQISGAIPTTIGNEKLKWETTGQSDVGLELGFFKNRLNLEVDAYRKITSNLLLNANVPTSSGYSKVFKNIGKVQNDGLEFSLNSTNIRSKAFTWTTGFNISFNKNKVLQLAEDQESFGITTPWTTGLGSVPSYIAKVGQSLGLMFGLIADGLYQYSDFDQTTSGTYILKDEITGNGNASRASIKPGDIKYRDLNGDRTIDKNDFTVIGRSLPIHIGGFTNNFAYKGFDLNIFFQWSYGNNIQNLNNYQFRGGSTSLNQYESFLDRWSPTNTDTKIVRTGGFIGSFTGYSTYTIEDGSYLRLKTLSMGYNLPASALKPLKIKAIRAYSSVQNLITWTKYSGQDPEVSLYNSVLTGGFDYSSYPKARTITLGLDVTF